MTTASRPPPEPGRRELKKLRTKEQLADVAWSLFAERGFDRVTVAEIALAADVSEQTVFNHFPTKEDLVFWRLGGFEDELLDAIRNRHGDETALAAFRKFMYEPRGLLDRRDSDAYDRALRSARMINESPALQAREQLMFASYTDALAAILAEEARAGEHGAAPWVAANAILGVHRAVVRYARRRLAEGVSPQRLAREMHKQVGEGVAVLESGFAG